MMTYEEEFQRLEKKAKRLYEEGKVEGFNEGKLETASNLKAKGIDACVIAECTGLTIEQVQEL